MLYGKRHEVHDSPYSKGELLCGALLTINGIAAGMRNTGLFQNLRVLLVAIPGTNRQRLLYSNRFLRGYSPGRLLDVGCGNGQFLLQMQACGWNVNA
jgi:SAM-dependent methyltransferase